MAGILKTMFFASMVFILVTVGFNYFNLSLAEKTGGNAPENLTSTNTIITLEQSSDRYREQLQSSTTNSDVIAMLTGILTSVIGTIQSVAIDSMTLWPNLVNQIALKIPIPGWAVGIFTFLPVALLLWGMIYAYQKWFV